MANPNIGKAPRLKGGLKALADKMGYTCGEMTLRRFVEAQAKLEEWHDALSVDTVPADMTGYRLGEARDAYAREMAALAKEELKLMEFFYPKMRASDDTVEHSGGLTVEIVKYGDRPASE